MSAQGQSRRHRAIADERRGLAFMAQVLAPRLPFFRGQSHRGEASIGGLSNARCRKQGIIRSEAKLGYERIRIACDDFERFAPAFRQTQPRRGGPSNVTPPGRDEFGSPS